MFGFTFHSKLVLLTGLLMFTATGAYNQPLAVNRAANCQNYLFISGESNVNQFTFSYNASENNEKEKVKQANESIQIHIPIRQFEASNPMMYKDFLELMHESEFPIITVSFPVKTLQNLSDTQRGCPEVSISIAGVTRKYNINCSAARCDQNIFLRGNQVIRLSDFKLKPPAKLLGLVKVNNEINVDFGFIITFTDENSISAKL